MVMQLEINEKDNDMIKIKNTNNERKTIECNGMKIIIEANSTMHVSENFLGVLPLGVIQITEQQLLQEIDPYTSNKDVQENLKNTRELLQEAN